MEFIEYRIGQEFCFLKQCMGVYCLRLSFIPLRFIARTRLPVFPYGTQDWFVFTRQFPSALVLFLHHAVASAPPCQPCLGYVH